MIREQLWTLIALANDRIARAEHRGNAADGRRLPAGPPQQPITEA